MGRPTTAEAPLRARPRDRHPGSLLGRRRLAVGEERPRPLARGRYARHARRHRLLGRAARHVRLRCTRISSGCARPETERIFKVGDDKLTLFGRESIGSWFEQALVARRQTALLLRRRSHGRFRPADERQFAGLTGYYGRYNFHYLTVTAHSDGKRELLMMSSLASHPDGRLTYPGRPGAAAAGRSSAAQDRNPRVRSCSSSTPRPRAPAATGSPSGGTPRRASLLSDECGGHAEHGSFTGALVGMAASGSERHGREEAVFTDFVYRPVTAIRATGY